MEAMRQYEYKYYTRSYLDWTCDGGRDEFIQEANQLNSSLRRIKSSGIVAACLYASIVLTLLGIEFFTNLCTIGCICAIACASCLGDNNGRGLDVPDNIGNNNKCGFCNFLFAVCGRVVEFIVSLVLLGYLIPNMMEDYAPD